VHRRVVAAAVAALLVVAVAVGAWLGWRATQRTELEQAVSLLPAGTLRASWTDWAEVRRLADGEGLDAASTSREVDAFVSRAYDQDLTTTSAVVESTYAMNRRYGFSPLDAEWEAFGQSREGAVVVLRLPESVDFAGVERNLRRLGYRPPGGGAGIGGVWRGSADLVASVDGSLTPVMQNVVVLPEERLVLLSDAAGYAASSASVVLGDEPALDEVSGVPELARAVESPASAVLLASDFACESLGMSSVDEGDRALADRLVEDAGGVSPLAGVVLALQPDRSLVVGMHFEDASQADSDLEPRVALAQGEAVGQGGTFAERFRVVEAQSSGQEIVMRLEPVSRDAPVLSDLAAGPVLFATC
jgi:hypothetical protein